MAGAVGELQLVALALLDVLDVRQQITRPVGGVGNHGVAQRHPHERPVAPGQPQLRPAALGRGPQQGADVLGVDEVGEGVAAHLGGGAAEQPAQRVVGAVQPAVLVAAHLGDGHAAGGVLEGLPEAFLTGAQRLLLALEPDQGALHVCAETSITDRNRRLRRIHLKRLAAPCAGSAPIARFVHGYDAEQLAARGARGVHRGEEPVHRVPLVGETRRGPGGVPLRDVVVVEDPALGVRDEPQLAPLVAHREPPLPRHPRPDATRHERLRAGAPGHRGHHQVAVRAHEIDGRELVTEPGHDTVGDGLQGVREAPRGVQLRDGLMDLFQGRKAYIRLRLGLHSSLSPETSTATPGFLFVRLPGH